MSRHNTSSTSAKPKTKRVPMPKGGRLWCIIKFLESVLVISCLLMLILTQYLNEVVDDFTPVKTENTTEPVETNTTATSLTTTTGQPPNQTTTESVKTTTATTLTTTTSQTTTESVKTTTATTLTTTTPRTPNNTTTETRRANEIPKIVIISRDSSILKDEHLESELMNGNSHVQINKSLKRVKKVSNKEELRNGTKSEADPISLNDLLIMFPCSTTLLMVIAMEIFGEMFKDPLSKLSNLILIFLAILLAITLFTVSLLAYLRTSHVTLILTSILSAFLVVVELINFILLQLS